MLFYKIIGSCGIVVASLWFSMQSNRYREAKRMQIDAYISLISFIRKQIECYNLPIKDILSKYQNNKLLECGVLYDSDVKSFEELLDSSTLLVDSDTYQILYGFANEFGTSYYNAQLNSCDRCIEELKKIRESHKEKSKKEGKLSFAICLSLSFSLIIILL